MPVTRTDKNQEWRNGQLVSEQTAVVDITEHAVFTDVVAKARAALVANRAYLALGSPSNAQNLAQIRALTRQQNGLIKALGRVLPELADLLRDETADT